MDACCATTAPPPLEWALLFSTGFFISLGHCTGMCGPIILAVAGADRERLGSTRAMLPSLFLYHTGRILSYALIGGALGLASSAAAALVPARSFQASLSIAAGLLMFLLALGFLGLLPTQSWVESSRIAGAVTRRIAPLIKAPSVPRRFALGMLNGFLPCGPVIAVAMSAIGASHLGLGMLSMLVYGAGTIPALLLLGLGTGAIPQGIRAKLFRFGTVLIVIVGLQLLLRGLSGFGIVDHMELGGVVLW